MTRRLGTLRVHLENKQGQLFTVLKHGQPRPLLGTKETFKFNIPGGNKVVGISWSEMLPFTEQIFSYDGELVLTISNDYPSDYDYLVEKSEQSQPDCKKKRGWFGRLFYE